MTADEQINYGDIVEWDGRRWWVSAWIEQHDDGPHRWLFSVDGQARSRVVAEASLVRVGRRMAGPGRENH